MSSHGGSSPRQFKVPIGTQVRRRHRRKAASKSHCVDELQARTLRLSPSPPSKAIAPYEPRSGREDAQLRFLIHHYVTVVTARTVTNVGPRFEWYPLAVRDEAFFHAVISSTSSHAAYLQQVELPRNFYFHRGEAIRLVNERIVRGARDEGTINAIAVFSQQESFEGRPETARAHINGLLQIVQAAGGLHSQSLSEKTRRHLYLTDLAACISLNSIPILPSALDITDLSHYFGQPSRATVAYTKEFGTRLYNFTNSPLSDQAVNILWGLRNISARLDDIHKGKESIDTAPAYEMQFTDRVEVLERLVHRLWYVENPEAPQHIIFRTFGWACLIYIYTTLRELPKELGMNTMLASRIRHALELSSDLNVLLATFQDLLLWQMFICGRVSDARDTPFFAKQATKILIVRKLEEASNILVAADGFLWPEKQPGSPARSDSLYEDGEDVDEEMGG